MSTDRLLMACLLIGVVPLWLLAGLADWFCHRRTSIETTSGLRESLLHSLLLIEIGTPALAALLLDINASVLLLAAVAFVVHELTTLLDLHWAQSRREIPPFEQHVHSFLEMLPLFALVLLSILYREQWQALFAGHGDFALRPKKTPLPAIYLISVFVATALLQLLPYGNELWRCWRARQRA